MEWHKKRKLPSPLYIFGISKAQTFPAERIVKSIAFKNLEEYVPCLRLLQNCKNIDGVIVNEILFCLKFVVYIPIVFPCYLILTNH